MGTICCTDKTVNKQAQFGQENLGRTGAPTMQKKNQNQQTKSSETYSPQKIAVEQSSIRPSHHQSVIQVDSDQEKEMRRSEGNQQRGISNRNTEGSFGDQNQRVTSQSFEVVSSAPEPDQKRRTIFQVHPGMPLRVRFGPLSIITQEQFGQNNRSQAASRKQYEGASSYQE